MTTEWQPIETCPDERPVLVLDTDGEADVWYSGNPKDRRTVTHWAPLPTMPEPDPMTVLAWHPMERLPDGHTQVVIVRYADPAEGVTALIDTERSGDRGLGYTRVAWCPLAPLLDLIPEADK